MNRSCAFRAPLLLPFLVLSFGLLSAQPLPPRFAETVDSVVAGEMKDKNLRHVAVAIVGKEGVLFSRAWGTIDADKSRFADERTRYRVGPVSQIVTSLTLLRLAQEGRLSLDDPIFSLIPSLNFLGTGGNSITLRHLLSHGAGLPQEPPIGNVFDLSSPDLATTMRSLYGRRLLFTPGSNNKYSHAGFALAGYVAEVTTRRPFEQFARETLLSPLSLTQSSFMMDNETRKSFPSAWRWTYHKNDWSAPLYAAGVAPATDLGMSLGDLSRLMRFLLNRGTLDGKRLVDASLVSEMWRVQSFKNDRGSGWGLGFFIDTLAGYLSATQSGSVNGFTTRMTLLPEAGLSVAVVIPTDQTVAVASRLVEFSLSWLVAHRANMLVPEFRHTEPIPAPLVGQIVGTWRRSGDDFFRISSRSGILYLETENGLRRLRMLGDSFVTDDRHDFGRSLRFQDGKIFYKNAVYSRVRSLKPALAPQELLPLLGEYGSEHSVLYLYEDLGRLFVQINGVSRVPLEPVAPGRFRFPESGLFAGEELQSQRNTEGGLSGILVGGVRFPRRAEADAITQFRIVPQRPVAELLKEAVEASPPVEIGDFIEPDLVEVRVLDSTVKYDIRYATSNNFMGAVFYSQQKAFLQRPAAEALVRAHAWLGRFGLGIMVHDAYRPWYVTKTFWDATPAHQREYVADPSKGSRHNRGAAVDVSLYDRTTGLIVPMVSGYDEFTERAAAFYPGTTALQRWYRELLRTAMTAQGFSVFDAEWWHFDYRGWKNYPILNKRFEDL